MTYDESIKFLYDLRFFGVKLGLDNTRRLAAQAGTPQAQLEFIHIAGTNGKGSVAAMLESIYRASGLRVGLYTSPHLVCFRERIQVNRQMISEEEVVRLVAELRSRSKTGFKPPLDSTLSRARPEPLRLAASTPLSANDDLRRACPTFFEFVTVMALRYFADQGCDLVIWETGLGGRLDATNIVTPLASVITNVEPDHQGWLGHDLKSIAAEKAGIIKPTIPIITATTDPDAMKVIQETALAQQSPLTSVLPVHAADSLLNDLQLPLHGRHQRINAATALATVQVLQPLLPVPHEAIRAGLENVHWPGRLQVIERPRHAVGKRDPQPAGDWIANVSATLPGTTARGGDTLVQVPLEVPVSPSPPGGCPVPDSQPSQRILLDGAHNASGAASLRAVLEEDFARTRLTLILGILEDKDWARMCQVLAPAADHILCVPVKSERSADPRRLAEACRCSNEAAGVHVMESVGAALRRACSEPFVVVAGSLYLVGEALKILGPGNAFGRDERGLNETALSRKD